jgi:hypothetical protein
MKDNHKKSKNIHTMLTSSIALISNAVSNKPDFVFIAEQMKKLEETERARREALEADVQ